MDESRKQFAEAFEELTGWELDDYPNQDYADTCWEFWIMSRAAIEIELPRRKAAYASGYGDGYLVDSLMGDALDYDETVEAIRAAGIKVKE
ncbi:hypothetical protein KX927_03015 [Escherichia coli]|uniref:hypothetical protein n=1 Tax=Escherichia coli TaxID=562 RepID=UPI0019311FBC|nr:hypothetical protein [Escherichia coli]MBL7390666.1 hypothetical protein [Escherichia coli]UWH33034.1 hypothetical protein KYX58_02380 [Escherichia coli]UWH37698.1 hypothetical protein KX927_03015 [Escherichia coli]